MKLSMGMKVSASLSLTPQLQQAIKLLQLSSLELEQEIQVQLDSNPLLEVIDPSEEHQRPTEATTSQSSAEQAEREGADYETSLTEQMQANQLNDDLPVDTQWDDIFTHQSTALATPEFEEREDNRTSQDSIWDYLRWQVNFAHFSPIDRLIAECIIDGIDERGYLMISLEDVLEAAVQQLHSLGVLSEEMDPAELLEYDIELEEVDVVLKRIQNLEPAGVGARSLQECLLLQLKNLPEHTPCRLDALKLLQHHELLIANDINRLMRQTQLGQDALKEALNLIKCLDPYPGQKFADPERDHQVPDVIVRKKNNRWEVQLNTDILPKLRVNPYYAGLIRRADSSSDNQYLRLHMQEARNFIKSVDERHKTLLKVSTCIIEHQRDFLEHGPEAMKPLILRDIAEETDLHESTVSRVTTQKYMLTPRGLFELKYFFSSHVGTSSGGECSSTAIRAMIKKMIQEENVRKPLSDNAIAEKLQSEGIDVARRTVAKYRESLNIPSSSERKRLL
ncbi:RNA polymerase factor sigma-54 [Alkanindiges illinoisensis]|uniref:RNA polymerase sigma-54 factor n=1 Tax=Alkanindiges illinoisensis TaxID=197183 RepID=A0A4Y7XD60_9GAMM|nr:RNA polymerase factor sigma-54 [Alkanindiges illinoisensis]TEU27868.1 RNA polymerase factor sigma-54 [Alkanindiges illinoisensis]